MRPRYRTLRRAVRSALGLAAVSLRLVAGAETPELNSSIPEEALPSNWINGVDLRAWSGYKDNVLLGNRIRLGSALVGVGADLTFYRLPVHEWEYTFLSSAEYVRYLSIDRVDHEATVILQGQAKKAFGDGWKAGLSLEYMFFDQVFDSSAFEDLLVPVPIQGHALTVRPSISKALSGESRLELELPGTRQIFDQFIDDFWEAGPKLSWIKPFARKSELTVSYQFAERLHDTREARQANGLLEPGHTLTFYEHELGSAWRQYWDADRRWRSTTKLALQRNEDNGGSYYAFWRPLVSEQVRYQAKTWEVRAEARVSYYDYDHQHVAGPDSALRSKTYLRLALRGEKALTKSFKLFGQYEREQALANISFDRYTANTFSAGISWEF